MYMTLKKSIYKTNLLFFIDRCDMFPELSRTITHPNREIFSFEPFRGNIGYTHSKLLYKKTCHNWVTTYNNSFNNDGLLKYCVLRESKSDEKKVE